MNKSLWRLFAVLALCLMGAGKKEPEVTVRFYTEVPGTNSGSFAFPVTLQNPPRKSFISKIADISERDISAIYPFQTDDGSIGCVFILDEHGKNILDTVSVEKRGTSLIALVNGRQVIDILIDRRVSDGILTVPRGMTLEEGVMLKKKFRVVALQNTQEAPPAKSQGNAPASAPTARQQ